MENTETLIGNVIGVVILIVASICVFLDAKAIGTDRGRAPGIVNTKPGVWAGGVFLALIFVLPIYLLMRVRYNRLLAQRRLEGPTLLTEGVADMAGVWPPPPNKPTV